MAVHISSLTQWRQTVSSSSIVVTDFYADWCGPCKMIAPTFESLASKYAKPGRITFAKVDVDRQPEVAQQYGVRAMPTFIILRNGSVLDTIQGANPPALTAAVEKAVKLAGPGTGVPGAAFSTPGRTLADSSSKSGSGGSASSSSGPAGRAGLARGSGPANLRQAPAFDLNSLINKIIMFFGLYITSLFSLDPYMAAQNSKYNIRNTTVAINMSGGRVGASTGSGSRSNPGSQARKPPSTSTFRTLSDLGSE